MAGFYGMAKRLFSFPTALAAAVARVRLPALEPVGWGTAASETARMLGQIALVCGLPARPVAGAIQPLIAVVLGDEWLPTADIVLFGVALDDARRQHRAADQRLLPRRGQAKCPGRRDRRRARSQLPARRGLDREPGRDRDRHRDVGRHRWSPRRCCWRVPRRSSRAGWANRRVRPWSASSQRRRGSILPVADDAAGPARSRSASWRSSGWPWRHCCSTGRLAQVMKHDQSLAPDRRPVASSGATDPMATVYIPTLKGGEPLERCLASLQGRPRPSTWS